MSVMNCRSFAPQLPVKWRDFEEGSDNHASTSSSRHSGDTRHAANVRGVVSFLPWLRYLFLLTLYRCSRHRRLYVMPTEIHREILAKAVYKPVYVLTERFDPISLKTGNEERNEFPRKAGTRTLWFGYSESFFKSMTSLIPIIMKNVAEHHVDEFVIIVDQEKFHAMKGNLLEIPMIPYDNATFRLNAEEFQYAILSHFPLDLKLNSYIKSLNKAITALLAGPIPIASDTPNYRELFERYGLQKFLFSSAQELDDILKNLDSVRDSEIIQSSGIVSSLLDAGSPRTVASKFLEIVKSGVKNIDVKMC